MTKWISIIMLAIAGLLTVDVQFEPQYAAQAQNQVPAYVPDEVIVRFRAGVEESKKDLARFRVFGSRKKVFKSVRGLEVTKLPPNVSVQEAIDLYEQDPNVLYAEPNYILKTTATPNDPRYLSGEMWGLNNTGQTGGTPGADIDAPDAWNITTGDGSVVVAIIDSGVDYNHVDLAPNIFQNNLDCDNNGENENAKSS